MYLLDTVAISESEKSSTDAGYATFVLDTSPESKFISVISIAELRYGTSLLPLGKRRSALESWVQTTLQDFSGRVLGVDEEVAAAWGELRAEMKMQGFTLAYNDLIIATTALYYDLTVVTRNVKDFAPTSCKLFNPWDPKP